MKMKFKKRNIKISIVSAMLAGSVGFSSANAGTDVTQNLTVNSSVGAVCTIATEAVAFGAYTGAQKDAVGKVKHTCTSQLSADIKIGKGTADSGTDAAPTRKMKNGVILWHIFFIKTLIAKQYGEMTITRTKILLEPVLKKQLKYMVE